MATLIDPGEVDEADSLEDSVSEETQESKEVAQESDDIPKEYKDKTPSELIKMHQEAVSKIGQQGNEVGELRRIVDDFILKQSTKEAPEPAEEVDFFSDPDL